MSPRGRKNTEGFYPNLSVKDVIRDGHVLMLRNPAGRKFGRKDAVRIDSEWSDFDELPVALERVRAEERARAEQDPPAWDPEFGYLTPEPEFCGNNLFIACMMHLEGLNMVGDLKATLAGLEAVRISYWAFAVENMRDTAHIYRLENRSSIGISEDDLVRRVGTIYKDLARQEINARLHLVEEDPRILADAIARSLAVLRAARLISPWELADMLSPIRLATSMGFIDGITKKEIDDFTLKQLDEPPDAPGSRDQERARDRRDADFADRMNRRFAKVGLNARGKELLDQ